MLKMKLYFDDAHVDNCHAANIEEAYYMKKNLAGFWDMNECCIDYWFNELKRPFEPNDVNLYFDMEDQETKCWILLDKITAYYSYDYTIIDNTIILDSGIANTIGLIKIGKNDIINGHFEFSKVEDALVRFLEVLKITNKNALEENGETYSTWRKNIIDFIVELTPLRKGADAYPILGNCFDFEILLNGLEDDDLTMIEDTLQLYECGEIDMLVNKDGKYVYAEDNQIKFGGIRLSILKWFESKITTEELIEEFTTLPF